MRDDKEMNDSGCFQDESLPKAQEMEAEYKGQARLLDLSDDVLLYILRYCKPQDLKALGFTCARLGALVLERSLWVTVDARGAATSRARMHWLLQALHAGTRNLLLTGHAEEARGCRGHVNRTRKQEEEEHLKPAHLQRSAPDYASDRRGIEIDGQFFAPQSNRNGEDNAEGGADPLFPLLRQHARLHINTHQQLPRQSSSPAWPEDCEWDDPEAEIIQVDESSEETGGCPGPVFTLTGQMVQEIRARCPKITSLSLEYCNINCNKISPIHFPPTLKRLSLRGTRCYNPPLDKSYLFRIHNYVPRLEFLDLSECAWLEPASLLPLSKLLHLKELLMRDCPAVAECVAYMSLASRYGFRVLKVLDLRGTPLSDSEVSALGWLPELQELYLSAPRPPRAPPSPPPHHHYVGDPLPRVQLLDHWETQIPDYYRVREVESDPESCLEDIEGQVRILRETLEESNEPFGVEFNSRMRPRSSLQQRNQPAEPPEQNDTDGPPEEEDYGPPNEEETDTLQKEQAKPQKEHSDTPLKHEEPEKSQDKRTETSSQEESDKPLKYEEPEKLQDKQPETSSQEESAKSQKEDSDKPLKHEEPEKSQDKQPETSSQEETAKPQKEQAKPQKEQAKPQKEDSDTPLKHEEPEKSQDKQPETSSEEETAKPQKDESGTQKRSLSESQSDPKAGPSKRNRLDDDELKRSRACKIYRIFKHKNSGLHRDQSDEDMKDKQTESSANPTNDDNFDNQPGPSNVNQTKDESNEKPSNETDQENDKDASNRKRTNETDKDDKDNNNPEDNSEPNKEAKKKNKMYRYTIEAHDIAYDEEARDFYQRSTTKYEIKVNDGASGSRANAGENAVTNQSHSISVNNNNNTLHCDIDVDPGAASSRVYSIKVQVNNYEDEGEPSAKKRKYLNRGERPDENEEPSQNENRPEQGESNKTEESNEETAGKEAKSKPDDKLKPDDKQKPTEEEPDNKPADEEEQAGGEEQVEEPPQRYVRFRRNQEPVAFQRPVIPGRQEQAEVNEQQEAPLIPELRQGPRREVQQELVIQEQAEPRHHVLYVNLGQQLHAVYRILPNRPFQFPRNRFSVVDHIDSSSLVSDSSIRRFGRADGEALNIVHIGPGGPQFGGGDTSGRPNRSSLRVISATGYRNITNRSLQHLATAAPHLRLVDFSETGVTAEGVEQFKGLRNDVEVRFSEFKPNEE